MRANYFDTKVYVSTYNKYNNGSLKGGWLNLLDYDDEEEFLNACRDLHRDEVDPEFMFQDVDCEFISICNIIGEDSLPSNLFEVLETFYWSDNQDALNAFVSTYGVEYIDSFDDAYLGDYYDLEEYADELFYEIYNVPQQLTYYIDTTKFARDLELDGYKVVDGHLFRPF